MRRRKASLMLAGSGILILVALIVLLNIFSLLAADNPAMGVALNRRMVLLLSLDGFRYDYIDRGLTPTLAKLADEGIMGPLYSQFPSYTFPNHFTLVTGLYPAHHGIVNNVFYDTEDASTFAFTGKDADNAKWWLAEPIWNTAERNFIRAGVLFWPGSTVPINGALPSFTLPYNGTMTNTERVNTVLDWIDSSSPPSFVALYAASVDTTAHHHGPNSLESDAALVSVDNAVRYLLEQLERKGLLQSTDIVVLSDHGMTEQLENQFVIIEETFPAIDERVAWADYGPVSSLIPAEGEDLQTLARDLQQAFDEQQAPCIVYTEESLPERYHYSGSNRIAPIIVEAKLGWALTSKHATWRPRGQHGYDPREEDMKAILIAKGPRIVSGSKSYSRPENRLAPSENLNVYPLLADLLGIDPRPSNGTRSLSKQILIDQRK